MALVALGIHYFQFGIYCIYYWRDFIMYLHCEYINLQHFTVHHFIYIYIFYKSPLVIVGGT